MSNINPNSSSATPVSSSVAERVFNLVAEESGQPLETIDRETRLGSDTFDSLDTVEMIMALEDEFEIAIPDDVAQNILTVGQLIDVIETRVALRGQAADAGNAPPRR